jgi:pimeloyl-ACP methyl ester carboxylesterase
MRYSTKLALGLGSAAAAGVAVYSARRQQLQRRLERATDVPFGTLHSAPLDVRANDGLRLHAEVDGDELPGPTIVFAHGYVENVDVWHYIRLALSGKHRMVFYDHRSHGDSAQSPIANVSMRQLADDLLSVLDATTSGPVVLVGHSMGGMTVMELAGIHPELFGDRVKAVILTNTSSGRLMVTNPFFDRLSPLVSRTSPLVQWGRGALTSPMIRHVLTGRNARPEHLDMIEKMVHRTRSSVFTHFAPLFTALDTSEGFAALGNVPTVVIAGDEDVLTPHSHGRYLSKQIAGATLVTSEGCGHFSMFEDSDQFISVLDSLTEKVAANQ